MNKAEARAAVWPQLRQVARPDSRFHFDFNEYIPDFEGSAIATARLIELDIYQKAQVLFITPDNCLEGLRAQAVRDGKIQLVSTYGIRRGIFELKPEDVPNGLADYAVLLDALERIGRPISLAEIRDRYRFDLIVTGASAVSRSGVRFGKGHGFFDLEWAMFCHIGVVEQSTPVMAFVHDCQVVDIDLTPSPYDTICDMIMTPTRLMHVKNAQKPMHGVLWDRLEAGMLESISPLPELKQLEELGRLKRVSV
jgi:5-formyltetrahydrofolate cyclo-ligase